MRNLSEDKNPQAKKVK